MPLKVRESFNVQSAGRSRCITGSISPKWKVSLRHGWWRHYLSTRHVGLAGTNHTDKLVKQPIRKPGSHLCGWHSMTEDLVAWHPHSVQTWLPALLSICLTRSLAIRSIKLEVWISLPQWCLQPSPALQMFSFSYLQWQQKRISLGFFLINHKWCLLEGENVDWQR